MSLFEHAIFGNRDGSHQLIETSLKSGDSLLEQIRFLVDRPAGHVGSEVVWSPYWGCGSLYDWWVLWRGELDTTAPRKNMVRTRVVMVRQGDIGAIQHLGGLFEELALDEVRKHQPLVGAVVKALSEGLRPVIVPDMWAAPVLLATLWPWLWPAARRCFSLRTFFGSESLASGTMPHVVIVPTELRTRWRSHAVVDGNSRQSNTHVAAWFAGAGAPELERLVRLNWDRLPGEFGILARLERITSSLRALHRSQGTPADALLIARTLEAFEDGLILDPADLRVLVAQLSDMTTATMRDIRSASLVSLRDVGSSLQNVEAAVSNWIEARLPSESDVDALWILQQQAGNSHVAWWLRAVRKGVERALQAMRAEWVNSIWRWWTLNPEAIGWTEGLLQSDSSTESAFLAHLPGEIPGTLQEPIRLLCAQREWAKLLASCLRTSESLAHAVAVLQRSVVSAESGLDVLLTQRQPGEIVAAAVACAWEPLVKRAVPCTVNSVVLLDAATSAPGYWPLLAAHLAAGGELPAIARRHEFIWRLFDGCINGSDHCIYIVSQLGTGAAPAASSYGRQDELWSALGPDRREPLLSATGTAWLNEFICGDTYKRPGLAVAEAVRMLAFAALRGKPIGQLVDFLLIFPEVFENQVVDWLLGAQFVWRNDDHARLAALLADRNWRVALTRFARSWNNQLNAVARHARYLLTHWEGPQMLPPAVVGGPTEKGRTEHMKIVFLAASPTTQDRLALDEEARDIEEKVLASKGRDAIEFRSKWAVRPEDLQQILLHEQPTIVHFSGHGAGEDGLVLHSPLPGEDNWVSSEALARLFKALKDNIRVVVLNACFSHEQAAQIVKEIDFVVGMADSIEDDAARAFAAAFYRGLAFGRTVQIAFDLGVNELQLTGLQDQAGIPELLVREGADAGTARLLPSASA